MLRRALIVEDDPDIAGLVQLHLRDIECQADIAGDGIQGLEKFSQEAYDLVILDLMLPGIDGMTVCKKIRAESTYVPILMLTARCMEVDRVMGLEIGADDYLVKPFSIPELLARIKALFRRAAVLSNAGHIQSQSNRLVYRDLAVDVDKREVRVGKRRIMLTAKEFELLLFFMSNPGRVYNRAQLLDRVWGYSYEGYEHTVNSHINRLRAKIEDDPAKPCYILTVWGVGYKFNES